MCQALCRCVVDVEFSQRFSEAQTEESANKFWHEFLSKGKTTKFLQKYNAENSDKCGLVLGEYFNDPFKVLGVGAHPNFFGWSIDFQTDWQTAFSDASDESMFHFSPKRASELVLVTASQSAFVTLAFFAKRIAENFPTLGLLKNNPMFKHCEGDTETIETISKNSALMFLMLCKLVNRAKPKFNAKVHL